MTTTQFFEIAGYFANPIHKCRIEIEARETTITNYDSTYRAVTGVSIPVGSEFVTSLPNNADKWGREMRLYFWFLDGAPLPSIVAQLMTAVGRPGYEQWNGRLNSNDIINDLLEIGFTIGFPQDLTRIRGRVDPAYINAFNTGFNI